MTDLVQKRLMWFRTDKGQNSTWEDWKLVRPEDVPEWVKHPDTAAKAVSSGEGFGIVSDATRPEDGWWHAEEAPTLQ